MYLHGQFASASGEIITVYILTGGDRTRELIIGDEDSTLPVVFTSDPVTITQEVNDTFDVLLPTSATINLLTGQLIPELFQATCFDAVVNIYRGDTCMFAGFIEPMAYSQPYNDVLDELSLNCIDVLSALQYNRYRQAGAPGVVYEALRASATQRTFDSILKEILGRATQHLDIVGGHAHSLMYDGSKAVDSSAANRYNILAKLSINEALMYGDDEESTWQQDEVLTEMLRYLNLHIMQQGFDFYVYSWETIKAGNGRFVDLYTGRETQIATRVVPIAPGNVYGTDAQISIGEVFNRISIKCEIASMENVIESPLDSDTLSSPFSNKQLYMTEYSSDGEGNTAIDAFLNIVNDYHTDYDKAVVTDWFAQVKSNIRWRFRLGGKDVSSYYTNQHQQRLLNDLARTPGAALVSFGKVSQQANRNDNAPVSKVSMSDYLVLTVNGNGNDTEAGTYPNEGSLKAGIPCAEYTSSASGGVFSPSDDDTTNYIVISGDIVLNPLMAVTAAYQELQLHPDGQEILDAKSRFWHKTVPSRDNPDGRYYTRRYYKADTPLMKALPDLTTTASVYPYTGTAPEEYEFRYSAVGDGTDRVSKVGVIACMLIIGDKCAVEVYANGGIDAIQWRPYKERRACASDDEYYQQSFTIGFNPKIGDKLIGTEFPIQNNISYTLGLDVEGTAIRVRRSDRISGPVRFMILGPANLMWDDVTRRHPTMFRHTKWTSTSIPLLAHVSSIFVKKFEITVHSDNGLVNNSDDKDIIYTSDTDEHYVNVKDDVSLKISSALTTAERQQIGVTAALNMGTPQNVDTREAVVTLYDATKAQQVKPEQTYVDSYYNEYHRPRVVLENSFFDTAGVVSMANHYTHPALPGKTFFVQSIERVLHEGSAKLKLKEIDT